MRERSRSRPPSRGLWQVLRRNLDPERNLQKEVQQSRKGRTIEAFWHDTGFTFGPISVGHGRDRSFLEDAKEYRGIVERVVESLPKQRGSKQPSCARQNAADCAYRLLYNFGKRPPVLAHEGPWQKLATILYGDENADLYKYLKTSTKPTTLLLDENAYTVTFERGC